MDRTNYKTQVTSRNLTYSYYRTPPSDNGPKPKPTLILLHGYPCLSNDWRHQVFFFESKGYSLIVPDMLGYGGTSTPLEKELYCGNGLAKDVVDIMDKEGVQKAVVIGHDWGSRVVSRLANLYPDRFVGFGFLALGYLPPAPEMSFEDMSKQIKAALGRETFGYMSWFAADGTADMLKQKFDSGYSLSFPKDPSIWLEHVNPPGAMEKWVESGRVLPEEELMEYARGEAKGNWLKARMNGNVEATLCWYKFFVSDLRVEEDKLIPKSSYTINIPVFYGSGQLDTTCVGSLYEPPLKAYAKGGLTIKHFEDCDHWMTFNDQKDKLNVALLEWIGSL